MSNNNIMSELSINQNGGTTFINRQIEGQNTEGPSRTRFHEVPGHITLSVGSNHPIYQSTTPMEYNAAKDPDTSPAEGFVTKQGTVQGDLTDDGNTLLRINGMEVDIPTAMKHGLVTKSGSGYALTGKAKATMKHNVGTRKDNAKAQAQNVHVADTRARSPKLDRLERAVGGPALHNIIQTTMSAISDHQRPKDMSAIETAAKSAGMSVGEVSTTISSAIQGSELRAKRALKGAGVNPEGVFEHLYERVEPTTRVSILSGLIAGDPAALNYAMELSRTGNTK